MRFVVGTTLAIAVFGLTTGGCGSISMVAVDGGDSGDAGSTGQAGSTGAGGRAGGAGPAGASGQAGSSGVAGATGVAGRGGTTGVAGSTTTGIAGSGGVAGSIGVAGRGGTTGVAGSTTTGVAGSLGTAGRGGTTGVAGSTTTGVAGSTTTGVAGSTGVAGRGGTTGVAGSGTGQAGSGGQGIPAAACPFKVPPEGATCTNEGIACEYGNDPRGDHCRTILVCSSQQWKYTNKPDPRDCPAIEYPPCNGRPGELCDPKGSYCYQSDSAACTCATCPGNTICLPGAQPKLYCTMPSSPGCPAGEPNMGTPCEIEKLECMYCPDVPRVCVKGIWVPGDKPCPIAAN